MSVLKVITNALRVVPKANSDTIDVLATLVSVDLLRDGHKKLHMKISGQNYDVSVSNTFTTSSRTKYLVKLFIDPEGDGLRNHEIREVKDASSVWHKEQ